MSVFPRYDDIESVYIYLHKSDSNKMLGMHCHNAYEIYILEDGDRSYMIEDRLVHLRARDVLLIRPNLIHCTVGGSFVATLMEFTEKHLKKFFTQHAVDSLTECFEKTVIRIRESDFGQLLSCVEKIKANENDFLAFTQLIAILNNNMSRKNYDFKDTAPKIADILDYISENYKNIDNLDMLADKFYTSRSHLCRLFKQHTNSSIIKYINILKVQSSMELLSNNNLTISEVAEQSGFKNLSYFGKVFKSIIGVSPLKYRKNIQSAKAAADMIASD